MPCLQNVTGHSNKTSIVYLGPPPCICISNQGLSPVNQRQKRK